MTLGTKPAKTVAARAKVPIQRGMALLRPVAAGVGARLRPVAELRARLGREVGTRFRLPTADDPTPGPRRIAGICGWAATLGIAGLPVGVMALFLMFIGTPGWYQPTVIAVGLAGIVCTIGALFSVHQRRLPWALLGAASAALLAAFAVTMAA